MVHIFPRPAVATSIISLFLVINPVSAHLKTPFRPRAHAAAIQLRSFNALNVDFVPRENVPLEERQLNERALLGDTLGGGVSLLDNTVNGVTSVVGNVLGGASTTTTPNPPANPAPTATATVTVTPGAPTTGGGNTGNPPANPANPANPSNPANPANPGITTVTKGSGNPTPSNSQNSQNTQNTQNTRSNPPSAIGSNPGQQTSKAVSITTTDANGSTVVIVTSSLVEVPGASTAGPNDSIVTQSAIAHGTGSIQKSTIIETKTHISTLPDGSVSTSVEITTSTVDVPRNGNNQSDDGDKGPSPVLIAVIVPFFVLLLVVGTGLFIWRRRKRRQAILLSGSSSPDLRPSLSSTSEEWPQVLDSTKVGLNTSAAKMGSGGAAVPRDMTERRTLGNVPFDPFGPGPHGGLPVRSPSRSSSHMSLPPDLSPVLPRFSQYPVAGTYPEFANVPDSSSEGHSSRNGYQASTETVDPTEASLARPGVPFTSPASPTTEHSYYTAFHEERRHEERRHEGRRHEEHRAMSPTQRISTHESIATPRASVLNPFADGAQVQRPSVDSGANIAIDYLRPVAPSPLASTFGPPGEPQPSSSFVGQAMRNRTLVRMESFATAKTGSTITLSPSPTRPNRGDSITSTEEFYSLTSHDSQSLSTGHSTSNGPTSSSGHYITAGENPFADPSQGSSEESRYSTASQASEASASSHVVSVQPHVVQHRATPARAEVVAAMPPRSPTTLAVRPNTGASSSSGQSIVSSEPDPDAARCVSPDEAELFYRPLPTHRERDERPSDETTVAEDSQRPIPTKARKILGVHT